MCDWAPNRPKSRPSRVRSSGAARPHSQNRERADARNDRPVTGGHRLERQPNVKFRGFHDGRSTSGGLEPSSTNRLGGWATLDRPLGDRAGQNTRHFSEGRDEVRYGPRSVQRRASKKAIVRVHDSQAYGYPGVLSSSSEALRKPWPRPG